MNVQKLVKNAHGDSVTEDALTNSGGILSSRKSPVSYLNEREQPHFMFQPRALRIKSDSDYDFGKGHFLIVTDEGVRFVSTTMDLFFPHETISSTGYVKKGRGYTLILGAEGWGDLQQFHIIKEGDLGELKDAINYIRGR